MSGILPEKSVTWLLILALGHVPVPWAHHHAYLGKVQLERHLARFHAECETGAVFGWHVHLICLGLDQQLLDGRGDGSSPACWAYCCEERQDADQEAVSLCRNVRGGKIRHAWASYCVSLDTSANVGSGFVTESSAGYDRLYKGVPLYDLYRSLLI